MSIICKFDDVSSKLVPERKAISFAFIKGKKTDHEQKKVRMRSNGIATDNNKLELLLTGTRFRHRMLCGILKSSTLNTVVVVTGSNLLLPLLLLVLSSFFTFLSNGIRSTKTNEEGEGKTDQTQTQMNGKHNTHTYASIRCKKCEICWIH